MIYEGEKRFKIAAHTYLQVAKSLMPFMGLKLPTFKPTLNPILEGLWECE